MHPFLSEGEYVMNDVNRGPENTAACCAGDGGPAKEDAPMIRYRDVDGVDREECPCARCREEFCFDEKGRTLIKKAIEFHYYAEDYKVISWREYSGMSGSDCHDLSLLARLYHEIAAAPGLYGLEVYTVRAMRGSLQIIVGAGLLGPDEYALAMHLLSWSRAFLSHLFDHHAIGKSSANSYEPPDELMSPIYFGEIDLEWAWRWAPRLAGLSINGTREVYKKCLGEKLEHFRENVAVVHDSGPFEGDVTHEDLCEALSTIEEKADEWHMVLEKAEHACEILNLSCVVFDLTSLIDRWVANSASKGVELLEDKEIHQALERIPSLVDWDACKNLKRLRDSIHASSNLNQKDGVLCGGNSND
jgi:hypothetical protein